tara:strand:- start:1791 stop:2849 length:1059 start_codon:yes stop_codon:yes gene_type:complete
MSSCCNTPGSEQKSTQATFDYLLWGSLLATVIFYSAHLSGQLDSSSKLALLSGSVFELVNIVWWGILLGIVILAAMARVPREFVMSLLATGSGFRGILRATIGGVLLDLCSHGILMVGAKLYERGASLGQVMAFLIASPWNSFTLTVILVALIGLPWTILFILTSMVIALISGVLFDALVGRKVLPENPYSFDLPEGFEFWPQAKQRLAETQFNSAMIMSMLKSGLMESRIVVRWILFGILLASIIRLALDVDAFQQYFGPTLLGLGLTMVAATIIEVCSEGSAPVAADLMTRAQAPGNSFAFLMGGVSTDYTEIMVLKDATRSWKIALFLPLVTLPQILLVAYLFNLYSIQ